MPRNDNRERAKERFISKQMKLELKNFRKHKSRTFDFPDVGLIHIQGANGQGKSTIFEAVYFALYGTIKKPYSFGENSCSVSLDLSAYGLSIQRTCRPNRLVVSDTSVEGVSRILEDDPAQALINERIMTEDKFLASSYVRHKQQKSILTMTPSEQVEFVRSIAFEGSSGTAAVNDRIKIAIKEMIKEANVDVVKASALVERAEKTLEEKRDPAYTAEFDVTEPPVKDTDGFRINHDKLRAIIASLQKTVRIANERIKTLEASNAKTNRSELKIELASLQKERGRYSPKLSDEELEKLERRGEDVESLSKDALLYDHVLELDQHLRDLEDERRNLSEEILSDEEMKSLEMRCHNIEGAIDAILCLKDVIEAETIGEYISACDELVTTAIFICPSCETKLAIGCDGRPICVTGDESSEHLPEDEATAIRGHANSLSRAIELGYLDSTTRDPTKLLEESRSELALVKRKRALIDKISLLIEELKAKTSTLEELEENIDVGYDYESELEDVKIRIEDEHGRRSRCEEIDAEISRIQDALREETPEGDNEEELEENRRVLYSTTEKLDALLTKLTIYDEKSEELSRYDAYRKYSDEVDRIEANLSEAKATLAEATAKYDARVRIRERIVQAEIFALDRVIENLNERAKPYLDVMFPNEPITVRIEQFKKLKTTKEVKCRLNVQIEYKGFEYESTDQLSGGELQKCELAFILAANEALNSKVLMLDECIYNMDGDVNAEVVMFLRTFARDMNKLVLVISHECVDGMFDSTMSV